MLVVAERISRHFSKVRRNATDCKVHLCELERGVGIFLSVDRDLLFVAAMSFNELDGLDEHTTGTATGVIEYAVIRLDHFGNQINDAFGRVELSLTFTFCKCELTEEVFIHTTDDVVFLVVRIHTVDFIQKRSELCSINM